MKKGMRTVVEKVSYPRKRWWVGKLLFPEEIGSRIEDLFQYFKSDRSWRPVLYKSLQVLCVAAHSQEYSGLW